MFNQPSPFFIELHFRQTAFVINLDGRAVRHGVFDVVAVNVISEDLRRVDVRAFNGRSGESDVGCVRQSVAQVLGEAVSDALPYDFFGFLINYVSDFRLESVLRAVGFVCDDDDVCSVRQSLRIRSFRLRA